MLQVRRGGKRSTAQHRPPIKPRLGVIAVRVRHKTRVRPERTGGPLPNLTPLEVFFLLRRQPCCSFPFVLCRQAASGPTAPGQGLMEADVLHWCLHVKRCPAPELRPLPAVVSTPQMQGVRSVGMAQPFTSGRCPCCFACVAPGIDKRDESSPTDGRAVNVESRHLDNMRAQFVVEGKARLIDTYLTRFPRYPPRAGDARWARRASSHRGSKINSKPLGNEIPGFPMHGFMEQHKPKKVEVFIPAPALAQHGKRDLPHCGQITARGIRIRQCKLPAPVVRHM